MNPNPEDGPAAVAEGLAVPEPTPAERWITTMWCPHNIQVSVPTLVYRNEVAGTQVYFDVPVCHHDPKPEGEFSVEEQWAGT